MTGLSIRARMIKSYKTYTETFGTWGYSLEFWEMGDISDWNKIFEMMMKDEELKKFPEEFFNLIIPGTHQLHLRIRPQSTWQLNENRALHFLTTFFHNSFLLTSTLSSHNAKDSFRLASSNV